MFAKRNDFIFDARRKGKKEKASTSSNFTQRKQREKYRLHKNDKEGQGPFSLCEEEEEEGYKEREDSIKRRNRESNQHL